jgi:hypothetical protein
MRRASCILAVCCAALGVANVASAQYSSPPLTCQDFVRNPDGSWSPIHPVMMNGVTMGSGVAFREGVSFGGVDLAAALDRQCH